MDLHRTSSTPARDAELPPVVADPADTVYPFPDADVRRAEWQRKEKALGALETQIMELWGNINAATARFLELVAEFDRREGWAQHGMASCAHWLNWQCGISPGAAREKVRTARALESLPKISAAFGEGRLSYSKVRALTRGATVETEDTLLHIALNGTAAHVEHTVRGFRRVKRYLERDEAEAMHERRYLSWRQDADGSVRIEARLTPEVGEMLRKALEAAHAQLEERGADAESAGEAESVAPADTARDAGTGEADAEAEADAVPAGVPAGTYRARPALPPCWNAAPEDVSAEHLPAASVSGARTRWSTLSEGFWPGVVHVPPPALMRSWCISLTTPCVTYPRAAVRNSTTAVPWRWRRRDGWVATAPWWAWSKARRASRWQSGEGPAPCRRPSDARCAFATGAAAFRGVTVPAMCTPITSGMGRWGETALDNLVTLCSFHHRQVHEGGMAFMLDEGEIRFTRPDGG